MRRPVGLALVVAWAGAVFAVAAPAQAHSGLAHASPGPGEEVAPGLSAVALTFEQMPASGSGRVVVTGPDDVAVPVGEPVLTNEKTLCVAVEPLAAGTHAVEYEAASRDGHPISGRFLFEVVVGGQVLGIPEPCQGVALPTVAAGPPSGSAPAAGPGATATAGGLTVLVAALAVGVPWLCMRRARARRLRAG